MSHNRDELDGLLKQAFAEGGRWPIGRSKLRTLSIWGLPSRRSRGISRWIRLRSPVGS